MTDDPVARSSEHPMRYGERLSDISSRREPSPIRALQPLVSLPGMISLGGGMPNPSSFPFKTLSVELCSGERLSLSEEETRAGLQYQPTPGYPPLHGWLRDFMAAQHGLTQSDPPQWDVTVATGSQDALSKAFEMLLNPGDALLLEDPTYPGALATLKPLGARLVPVPTDGDGLQTSALERILTEWDESTGPRPRVLYAITEGQNPSGSTLSLQRRNALLSIARKHDLLILEDSPYFYLQFAERLPSLLSLDTDGRVLRFDSLSKVLSSGVRIGWATGPMPLIERIRLHMQASCLHASGISQVIVHKLLQSWGSEGLERHFQQVVGLYRDRCARAVAAVQRHLSGRVSYAPPKAGMFLWLGLHGIDDTETLITQRAVEAKVLFVPGRAFSPTGAPSSFVRASFSTASEEQMDAAFERLATLIDS